MPCSDSSSSMVITLDQKEHFQSFEYAKITCGQEIKSEIVSLNDHFNGMNLEDIINSNFQLIADKLGITNEEDQFILYMEWDALRCAIGLYLGVDSVDIDIHRCVISSIDYLDDQTEIALVILPPKEMPKILPCNLNQGNNQ